MSLHFLVQRSSFEGATRSCVKRWITSLFKTQETNKKKQKNKKLEKCRAARWQETRTAHLERYITCTIYKWQNIGTQFVHCIRKWTYCLHMSGIPHWQGGANRRPVKGIQPRMRPPIHPFIHPLIPTVQSPQARERAYILRAGKLGRRHRIWRKNVTTMAHPFLTMRAARSRTFVRVRLDGGPSQRKRISPPLGRSLLQKGEKENKIACQNF